jgi:hypothetical protein
MDRSIELQVFEPRTSFCRNLAQVPQELGLVSAMRPDNIDRMGPIAKVEVMR